MEDLPNRLANSGAQAIKNRLMAISGGKILDVGTESGDFIQTLIDTLKEYDSVIGIDISKKELESAKERWEDHPVKLLEMNAESLDFETDSFDTVCISYTVHHLAKTDRVLAEMKRVLKPGVYFLIQEMYGDGNQTEAQYTGILQHHWWAEIDSLQGEAQNKTLPKQQLKEVVEHLGLKDVEMFDSTHLVKCLFCEDKFECDDPLNEQIIHRAIKEIDDGFSQLKAYLDLNNLKEDPNVKRLQEEGEQIKERIKKFGVSPESQLFIIGKK